MSPFDADNFMNTQSTESNATKVIPVPPGEYNAQIKDLKVRDAKDSKVLDVIWELDSEPARQATGRKEVQVRQSLFLDFNDNGGLSFAEGKNVGLGRLRQALNQNNKGQPWSPINLKGGVAKINVTHRVDKDTGDIYDQVSKVAPLS